jgi:hypothetical protein
MIFSRGVQLCSLSMGITITTNGRTFGRDNVILFPNSPVNSDSNPTRAEPILTKQRLGGLLRIYHRRIAAE